MQISDKGIELITSYEGLRLKAYKDSVNVWTIGYGHTRTAKEGLQISKEQAEELLKYDLRRFEAHVNSKAQRELTQNEYDALVSFAFNLGSVRDSLWIDVNNNDSAEVVRRLELYHKAGGKYLLGLHRRRVSELIVYSGFEYDWKSCRSMKTSQLRDLSLTVQRWLKK